MSFLWDNIEILQAIDRIQCDTGHGGPIQGVSGLHLMEELPGACAVFRNPAGHRQVDYADLSEAAEAVQTASLLLRILDRVEDRLLAEACGAARELEGCGCASGDHRVPLNARSGARRALDTGSGWAGGSGDD